LLTEDQKWHKVSLRIVGDQIPIDEIAAMLDIQPSYIGRIGEHINNNPKHAKHEINLFVWRYTTDTAIPFEDQISDLLEKLELKKQVMESILSIPNTYCELFLGFGSGNGQGGAYLSPQVLTRLSVMGMAISLDFYPSDSDIAEALYENDCQT